MLWLLKSNLVRNFPRIRRREVHLIKGKIATCDLTASCQTRSPFANRSSKSPAPQTSAAEGRPQVKFRATKVSILWISTRCTSIRSPVRLKSEVEPQKWSEDQQIWQWYMIKLHIERINHPWTSHQIATFSYYPKNTCKNRHRSPIHSKDFKIVVFELISKQSKRSIRSRLNMDLIGFSMLVYSIV